MALGRAALNRGGCNPGNPLSRGGSVRKTQGHTAGVCEVFLAPGNYAPGVRPLRLRMHHVRLVFDPRDKSNHRYIELAEPGAYGEELSIVGLTRLRLVSDLTFEYLMSPPRGGAPLATLHM